MAAPSTENNDFYYSALNLPKTASQSEITEHYRTLSLTFHPDKQHDEACKTLATKKFQEIQMAYEVLSDPFLREVYDMSGEKGLRFLRSSPARSMPREEIKKLLKKLNGDLRTEVSQSKSLTQGDLSYSIDAVSLFGPYRGSEHDAWLRQLFNRFQDVRILMHGLNYKIEKSLNNEETRVSGRANMSFENRKLKHALVGAVRHQFSPRFSSELRVGLIPRSARLIGTYNTSGTTISTELYAPLIIGIQSPSLNISISQQLFHQRLERATLEVGVSQLPHISFNLMFPKVFGIKSIEAGQEEPQDPSTPPSTSGLRKGLQYTQVGISFDTFLPKLVVQYGVAFTELALKLTLNVEYGLTGLGWVFSGQWAPSPRANLSMISKIQSTGVVLCLDAEYLEQTISLPMVLSTEFDPELALYSVLVPSVCFALGYHFVVLPRRRKRRLDSIRAARRILENDLDSRRERETMATLLKDAARKSRNVETSKDGLVIGEATWGSAEKEDDLRDLVIDVTVPIQALVHNSQLYIPGDRVKSNIRGFVDPAPFTEKVLCIRYRFRDKTHYTEIREDFPVVLPLAEHVVD